MYKPINDSPVVSFLWIEGEDKCPKVKEEKEEDHKKAGQGANTSEARLLAAALRVALRDG